MKTFTLSAICVLFSKVHAINKKSGKCEKSELHWQLPDSEKVCLDDRRYNYITGYELPEPFFAGEAFRDVDPYWKFKRSDGKWQKQILARHPQENQELFYELREILYDEGYTEEDVPTNFLLRSLAHNGFNVDKTLSKIEKEMKKQKTYDLNSTKLAYKHP